MIPSSSVWPYRLVAAALIVGAAAARLLYLANDCPLDLAPDEAHYWDWSRHLDWSYYSKGPLVAWLIHVSCWLLGPWSISLVGTEMLAVRIPAIVCGSLMLAGLYVLTVQSARRDGLALALVAIALTMPLMAAGSLFMTIDSPYTCCWTWALVAGHHALFRGSTWAWLAAGGLVGLGILAKYTMVLWLPCLGLFLVFTPGHRAALMRPGFWIAAVVAVCCCLPIVIWNAQNDWVTLRHTRGHAGLQSATLIHWLGPLTYLGMQCGILLGFWFALWSAAAWCCRPGRETRSEVLYLWWMSAPVFVFFGLFSLKNGGGEPNWPVVAYLSGAVLATVYWGEALARTPAMPRRWLVGAGVGFAALGLALTVVLHRTIWIQPVLVSIVGPATAQRPLPLRKIDPTARLRGWRTLAAEIDRLRERLRAEGIEPELAGDSWSHPGEIGFYCAGHPTAYNFGPAYGGRHSQYDLWRPNPVADPEAFRGKTFIVVGIYEQPLRTAFERVESTIIVTHEEHGHAINAWAVTVAHGFRGFPRASSSRHY